MSHNNKPGHDAAQHLRITIAITALRFKPKDQSLQAYVLDLRAKFPAAAAEAQNEWRARALALEKDLQALQLKYESEHIELLSLRDARPPSQPSGESATANSGKKRQKKKANVQVDLPAASVATRPTSELKAILGDKHTTLNIPLISSNKHVLSAFQALDIFVTVRSARQSAEMDRYFVGMVTRAIDALNSVVETLLPPHPTVSASTDTLAALAMLSHRLLTTAIPLLAKSDRREKTKTGGHLSRESVLERMTELILVPLICAFAPLSKRYITALFSDSGKASRQLPKPQAHKRATETDLRPDVFAAIERIVSTLDTLTTGGTLAAASCTIAKSVLALEAARQLQALYPDREAAATSGTEGSGENASTASGIARRGRGPSERLEQLIRKDTLWYLCHTLHLVLPAEPRAAPPREQDVLLEDLVFATFSDVLRRTKTPGSAARTATAAGRHEVAAPQSHGDVLTEAEKNSGAAKSRAGPCGGVAARRPRFAMSEVERGMVLAVIERAWLGR
ncbi:uncharacterized protein FIBRA_00327 [Fibroporia radiculosa]|uniref:Uncharacterized protein n=1 Tax=Fibroporia radiculosa TaxID=599839 RepID=J7SCQ8_9APHY|nr:uncharacterized protein FIBRA_00327 [Fibroporia radiculosa]CCL98333.1 predicted protein [Fibroporia radiculosa]